MGKNTLSILMCIAFALSVAANVQARQSRRPNVVFILADDLGWSDTTLHGTTRFYQTPNIERLAARGMRFKRAYAASPLCSPTRASILTGMNPARIGITTPACHLPQVILKASAGKQAPAGQKAVPTVSATRLSTHHYTLAEALKDAGYATGHFGKWHLGHSPFSPLQHGFDVDVPHWPGPGPAGSYVAPWRFPDFDPDTPNEHIEDRMAKEAVAFIEKHKDRPFFLNYWMFSVHAPFDAKAKLIEKHRQRIDPKDEQRSPTYAAMIESMDDAVGELLDALDRLNLSKNTILIFASDNGGNMYNQVDGVPPTSNRPLRGGKATMFEGGVRGPCVVVWPGVVRGESISNEIIQSCDFYPTLLEMLAIPKPKSLKFDGVSLLPALRGRPIDRDAIFTYFPHNPRVPDWLPPSVSVHSGDWKLIRIFHGGENQRHRWKLFNLAQDPGEKRNLVADHPERVQQLDRKIEKFLKETAAVLPIPNPRFDPDAYRPDQEGVPQLRKAAGPKRTAAKPVAGWRPSRDCELKLDAGDLVIQSTGRDPYIIFDLPKTFPAGAYRLRARLQSKASGRGQFFWKSDSVSPPFHRDRSVTFDLRHGGKSHDLEVSFAPEIRWSSVRLDPAQGRGEIRVQSLQVVDAAGKVAFEWRFESNKRE